MSVNRVFAVASSLAVAMVLGVGLYLGGSPSEQRLIRYDERRVNDLRVISDSLQNRWNRTQALPASLDELVQGQEMSRVPVDPESGESYGFDLTGENSYRLCAQFSLPSVKPAPGEFWAHEAGYQCFTVALNVFG
jgi:hypothetical protein